MFAFFFLLLFESDSQDLVKKLGDHSFRIREEAQAELTRKMDFGMYIELKSMKQVDLETKIRIDTIVKYYELKLKTEYKVDLKGYSQYPWICEGLPKDYEWSGLNKYKIRDLYIDYAFHKGIMRGHQPTWTGWRAATELWIKDRIDCDLRSVMKLAKSEKEFRNKMNCRMESIQKDLELMIQGDDAYWGGKEKNPLRVLKKIEKNKVK